MAYQPGAGAVVFGAVGDVTSVDAGDTAVAGSTGKVSDAGHGHGTTLTAASAPALTSYSPAWTSTGTAPSLGDGVLLGRYALLGDNLMFVSISLLIGSTTTVGSGNYSLALPAAYKVLNVTNLNQTLVGEYLDSSSGSARWPMAADCRPNGTTVLRVYSSATANAVWTANSPVVPAVGDFIIVQGVLMVEPV